MKIWVPKAKIIEPKRELVLGPRMAGRFKMEAVSARTGRKRLLADWFDNIVLDQGLDHIGNGAGYLIACRVGTGNTAPTAADTNLVAHVAGTSDRVGFNSDNSGASDYYTYQANTYRFAEGAAAGNIAEVGVGQSTSDGANLFSRALVLDGGGSPTTVTVLADEFLDVTYELRNYPPLVDVVDQIDIGGVTYDYTLRAYRVDQDSIWRFGNTGFIAWGSRESVAYSGGIGAVTGTPSGTQSAGSSSVAAYTPGNLYRDGTAVFGLTQGNVGGVAAVHFGGSLGRLQIGFSPAIPKDNTNILTLVFRLAWARKSI